MKYYSAIKRNGFESVLLRWMNLEPIIQRKLNQKEKDKYHILMHLYRIQKKWYCKIYLQGSNGETDIENRLMAMGRGEERVRCMERISWKLTLPYVKQIANRNLLYGSENSNGGSVSTQRSGMGQEMGGRPKGREYMYTYG